MSPKEFRVRISETAYMQLEDIREEKPRARFLNELIAKAFSATLKKDIDSVEAGIAEGVCPICGDLAMYKGKKQWICRKAHCKGVKPFA